jgi:hypothetical protein
MNSGSATKRGSGPTTPGAEILKEIQKEEMKKNELGHRRVENL